MARSTQFSMGLLISLLFAGCASTPAPPQIQPTGEINGITLPADCGAVQFKITMTQDPSTVPGATGAHVEGGGVVQNGTVRMPDLSNFDFARAIKIHLEVVRGNCPPFVPPAAWDFEGLLQSLGNGKYSAPFSGFRKR